MISFSIYHPIHHFKPTTTSFIGYSYIFEYDDTKDVTYTFRSSL